MDDSLLDKASDYIEKLTDKISQQQNEVERLELTVKEQGFMIDEMVAQQQIIHDLKTTIEVMTLDLESRSDTIVSVSSLVVKLHEHLTRFFNEFDPAAQNTRMLLEFQKIFGAINKIEKIIRDTSIPGICASSSTASIVSPDNECTHVKEKEQTPEDSELQYYKNHCQALERQITTLRDALLSQEEISRKIAVSMCSLPLSHRKQRSTITEHFSLQPSCHDVLLKMLQWVDAELYKSPKLYLNNAFSQEFSTCLKAVAMGASVSSQPLPRFSEAFTRLLTEA